MNEIQASIVVFCAVYTAITVTIVNYKANYNVRR